MKFLILLISLLVGPHSFAQTSIRANIATQMVEDGEIDNDRYFIFYFTYIDLGAKYNKTCDVMSITVNNRNCSRTEMGGNKSMWLKPEYSSPDYNGRENFICKYRKINDESAELVVTEKSLDYQISHRLITDTRGKFLLDYKGQLSKTSSITKKIESVEYRPIKAKSPLSGDWEQIEMGCNRMTIPVLPKK
jgi:hypothetical protein